MPAAGRRDQNGPAAGGGSRHDVAVGISDHPRGAEVHVELGRRVEEHARGWLPAPARLPELRHRRLGMVETAPDRVGYNPLAPQQVEHALLDRTEPLDCNDALRGRRLVRDRYQQVAGVTKTAECRSRTWNQRDVVGIERRLRPPRTRIADQLVDNPLAVKEYGRPADPRSPPR